MTNHGNEEAIKNKLDEIIQLVKDHDAKNNEFQRKISSILLRMNERDCNRDELYEELDKFTKEWFSSNMSLK